MGYNDEAWLGLKEIKPQKKIGSNFYYASLQPTTSLTRARSAPPSELTTTPKKDTKKRNVDTPPHQPQRKRQPPVLRKARSAPLKISTDASTPQKTLIEIPTVEEVEEEEVQPVKVRTRNSVKKRLTLVVVGHVDAGKSTLMGHLLYSLDVVSKKTMRKFEKMSKQIGKASFKYAWVRFECSSCQPHFYIHTNSRTAGTGRECRGTRERCDDGSGVERFRDKENTRHVVGLTGS